MTALVSIPTSSVLGFYFLPVPVNPYYRPFFFYYSCSGECRVVYLIVVLIGISLTAPAVEDLSVCLGLYVYLSCRSGYSNPLSIFKIE